MNYFILFSAIIIAVSVVILLIPSSNAEEGFATHEMRRKNPPMSVDPSAAGQRNASSHAGSADGSSDHDFLLDTLLLKHDKLAEGFENREKKPQNTVSATTTQKKGIATTSASTIPVAGCNKDKCMEIGKTQSVFDPMAAIDGNCVNPTLPNGEPDYSTKYCAAFRPKDDTMDAQECLTCGYYTYTADCVKYDIPNNPTKCLAYGDYKFQQPTGTSENYLTCETDDTVCQMLAQQTGDQGQGQGQGQGSSGPSCSTCQLQVNDITKCVLPGCHSADDGYLPFPDDDGYNFAEGCFYYNPGNGKVIPGMQTQTPGYYCPPITQGSKYDASSSDPCYTKPDPNNLKSNTLDYSKYIKIDSVCSNDKQKSKQQFKPGKDAPIDGTTTQQHSHKHAGAVNVYHHHMYHGSNKNSGAGNNKRNSGNGNGNGNGNGKNTNKNQGYMEPVAGAGVLGFL
jgi:hypothetical protein